MRFNAVILLLILWSTPLIVFAEASLKSIKFSALPGDRVQISLGLTEPVADPVSFTTENPARISLDFAGVSNVLGYKTKVIGVGPAHSITALQAGNRTRVVINLTSLVGYKTEVKGSDVLVTLDVSNKGIGSSTVTKAAVPSVMPASSDGSEIRAESYGIANVDFRRGEAGEGRVLVTLTNSSTPVDVREEGGKIVVEAFKTNIDSSLVQSLDVMDFATPITKVDTKPVGENVRIEISPSGEYDYLAYQANEIFTVEVRSLTSQEKEALQKERLIFTGERLSLNFQDIEVRAVLQLLADFTGLNLVTSDTVGGRITLRLK
ncbi:MAG: pilus assembly protein PilQ, partial [gamma proteobacterium symbiont of Ctena orbiculata]